MAHRAGPPLSRAARSDRQRSSTAVSACVRRATSERAPQPHRPLLPAARRGYGTRAVGIVLSGSGSDGALGLSAIGAGGGMTMAQTPDSAAFPDMPNSVVAAADHVLAPAELAGALARLCRALAAGHAGLAQRGAAARASKPACRRSATCCCAAQATTSSTTRRRPCCGGCERRMQVLQSRDVGSLRRPPRPRPPGAADPVPRAADRGHRASSASRTPSRRSPSAPRAAPEPSARMPTRSASGCRAARPARKPIRSPCSCASRWTASNRGAGPDLRHRRRTSARSPPRGAAATRRASPRRCRRSGSPASSSSAAGATR